MKRHEKRISSTSIAHQKRRQLVLLYQVLLTKYIYFLYSSFKIQNSVEQSLQMIKTKVLVRIRLFSWQKIKKNPDLKSPRILLVPRMKMKNLSKKLKNRLNYCQAPSPYEIFVHLLSLSAVVVVKVIFNLLK